MRRDLLCAAVAAFLLVPAGALARPQGQNPPPQSQDQTPPAAAAQKAAPASSQTTTEQASAPVDPLAAAARKAREQKKDQPKPARVFDNDNLPKTGGISAVGSEPATETAEGGGTADATGAAPAADGTDTAKDEKAWRGRFEKLRHKLDEDQADLDIMQRELGVLDVQYYNDPMKAMQQGYSRSDIDEKTAKIEAKKKLVEEDQQAISDAEEELRRSGGDPGWAR
ncbi:MAG: hypothetical protein WB680_05130 [Candidatus Acidiferrales bacterium]